MKKSILFLVLIFGLVIGTYQTVQANKVVTFTASIAQGTLLANIRGPGGTNVPSPNVHLGNVINASNCRYDATALRQNFGTNDERIFVDNPNAATNGWTLTIAPVGGSSSLWDGAEGGFFDFNDAGPSGLGCSDNDGDGHGGELKVDVTNANINKNCISCTTNHISLGSNVVESFANSPSITLLMASDMADSLGSWYITDVEISQSVPAGQDGDDYSIDFVLTATAS